jgi:hypothetical protein
MTDLSRSDFVTELNGKMGFTLIGKGDHCGTQAVPRQMKALRLGIWLWHEEEG